MCMRFVQGTGSTEARSLGFIETAKAAGFVVAADPYPDTGTIEGCKTAAANTLEKFVKNGVLELDGNGQFQAGRMASLRQLPDSGLAPDPAHRSLDLLRRLSRLDFPGTGARFADDGSFRGP